MELSAMLVDAATQIGTRARIMMHLRTHARKHTPTHARTHAHTHTRTHAHTYACVCVLGKTNSRRMLAWLASVSPHLLLEEHSDRLEVRSCAARV